MTDKALKNKRILDMYVRLCEGKIINKAAEAQRFGVDERSIQRDIDDIRAFLSEQKINGSTDSREVIYDRVKKGFVLSGAEGSLMSNSEILAVSKILLESRAFTKKEISTILDKMIAGCVPYKNIKLVSDLIANEKYHYVELSHKSSVKDMLWELGEDIKNRQLIEITYQKQMHGAEIVKRVVQPAAVIFSEYYFYLNAYIVEKNEKGDYERKYDYPAVFRLDRIRKRRNLGIRYRTPYANRFEEGEFRNRIQFMFAGELIKLRIKYKGNSVDAILDRLPTAAVILQQEDFCIIEAEVYGNGIMMWLLSQGTMVEILKPDTLRNEMKAKLKEMLDMYDSEKH
ncbi:MAG: WYL domain-containing protein [Clostridiaceae bacterium]|nr:WYL domain-containing protein [Clostridiaceae bacterium]